MFERSTFRDFYRVYRRILFASFLFVAFLVQYSFGNSPVSKQRSITYDCVGGTLTSGYTSPQISDSNGNITLYSGDACTRNGYDFFMWLCASSGTTTSYYGNEQLNISGNKSCEAVWNESCYPGERVYTSVTGFDIPFLEQPNSLANNESSVQGLAFSTGTVNVSGLCSQTNETPQMTGNPSSTPGPNCWCHVVGAQETGGQYNTISNTPWVLLTMSGQCQQDTNGQWVDVECSYQCSKLGSTQEYQLFLSNLMFTSSCVYPTLTYHNCNISHGYGTPQPVSLNSSSNSTTITLTACIASVLQPATNYTFGGYYCVDSNGIGTYVSSSSLSYNLTSDTDCYAIWNEINPCDPGSVSSHSPEVLGVLYDNNLNSEWEHGITFSDLFNPTSVTNGGNASNTFGNGNTNWTVAWDEGLCSSSAGQLYHAGAPNETQNSGDFCWCRVSSVTDGNGTLHPLRNYPWVFFGVFPNCTDAGCQAQCDDITDGANPRVLNGILQALYTKTMCRYQINWDCNNPTASGNHSSTQNEDAGATNIATYGGCGVPPNSSFGSWSCVTATTNETVTINGMGYISSMPWDNVNCTASWTQIPTYPVIYDCNNDGMGGAAPGTNSYVSGDSVTLSVTEGACNAPTNGVGFTGWDCYQTGNLNNSVGDSTSISSMPAYSVTCYARWNPFYYLSYRCDESASPSNDIQTGPYQPETSVSLWASVPNSNPEMIGQCSVQSGDTFNGWNCVQTVNGVQTVMQPLNTYGPISMPYGDVLCIAQWARVCTITLDPSNGVTTPNGGDSSSSANNIKTIYSRYGDGAYKTNTNGVLSNKMTSQSGLADTPPSPALGIPVGRYVTITFDAQTPAPTNPVTGNQYSVTNPNNSVGQRSFAGYYSIQSSHWDPTQPYIDADGYITSYGQSAAENINPNNDSCPTWYAHYTCPTIFLPYVNLDGYTLMRWRTSNGSISLSMSGKLQGRHETLCLDADLNAIWQANTYTIRYVLNGGTYGTNHPTSATYNSEFTVSNPTRNGYTFAGWTITGMDGITHYYSDNPIISNGVYQSSTTQTTTNTQLSDITDTRFMNLRSTNGTVTFTAQWTQTQYTITYTCGDAGGTMSSNTNTVNTGQASYTVKPNVTGCDSYNGYHFTGWLCTPDLATGTGTATYSNTYPTNPDVSKTIATIGLSGNATCVAQWGQNIVNLLWNDNGATTAHSGTQSDSCLYGPGDITVPTTPPTRTGYSFSGWKVTDWWHRLLDRFTGNVHGTCYCHRRSNNNWGYTGDACSSLCYSAPNNTWGLRYHNNDATGIIIGTATCSNQSTTLYTTGDPGATSGQYCWCRVTSYTRGDISEQYNDLPWVYAYDFSSSNCNSSGGCLEKCGSILYNGNNSTFQNALFGQ